MKYLQSAILALCLAGCIETQQPGSQSTVAPREEPIAQGTTATTAEPPDAIAKSFRVLAWNVESDGNDPAVIAKQLAEFAIYDVVCLNEVRSENFQRYADALGRRYQSFNGKSGRSDRLQIPVDQTRFEILESKELTDHGDYVLNRGYHRSPFFVRLKDRETGIEFVVMTNHLARGNAEFRKEQAIGLREWARDQAAGVIAIGDVNMDYDYIAMQGNSAFDEMVRDNVWSWIRPVEFIDTNWSDRDGDGKDNYPDSMLDLAFVSGPAKEWKPVCEVIVRDGDFPDDESTSDHRPISLTLSLGGA